MERTQPHETEANFSIGVRREDCGKGGVRGTIAHGIRDATRVLSASAAVLTGIAVQQNRLPRKFGLLDLALLGIATHKLSRIVAKDRITGILRAPFVSYIRSAGAGEVEEEPRGRGFQRGIGHLISCPYCMAPWCATALSFGLLFAPRVTRFFAGILVSVTASDFLHRAYAKMKEINY